MQKDKNSLVDIMKLAAIDRSKNDTFGSSICGVYCETSTTLRGAKNYATRHELDNVYCRINGSLHLIIKAKKIGNKWINVKTANN